MRTITMLVIAGLVTFTGCSDTGSEKKAVSLTNADLEAMVSSKLATEPQLAKAISVSADADKNEVKLSGTVPDEPMRTRAVELTKSAKDGLIVTDKIDVKPLEVSRKDYTEDMARRAREEAKSTGDAIGNSVDDAWIHTKITAKLIGDSKTPARKINVDVVNQVVTLRGEVDTKTAKDEADKIAHDTEGVKRVRNLLKVTAG